MILLLFLMSFLASADEYQLPEYLSDTPINHKNLIHFKPEYPLWTDGAIKERWMYIPEGTQIHSFDINHWNFPVGTWAFKQFSLKEKKLETRVFVKTRNENGIQAWQMAAYIWNEEQTHAKITYSGATNVLGTNHDVPSQSQCVRCHSGGSDANLGFSAFQLAPVVGELVRRNLLSHPPKNEIKILGTPLQKAALGYLHANCSHCHSPGGLVGMFDTYYDINTERISETSAYKTLVDKNSMGSTNLRIKTGSPEQSYAFQRMVSRTTGMAMPPLGTEEVDSAGTDMISEWIKSLAYENWD